MARSSTTLLFKGVGALVILAVAGWLVLTLLEIVAGVLSMLFTLAVVGAVVFGLYWVLSKAFGRGSDQEDEESTGSSAFDLDSALDLDTDLDASFGSDTKGEADDDDRDPVERLREQYAKGRISEAEFEQGLERHLSTRSLEREVGMREEEELERN